MEQYEDLTQVMLATESNARHATLQLHALAQYEHDRGTAQYVHDFITYAERTMRIARGCEACRVLRYVDLVDAAYECIVSVSEVDDVAGDLALSMEATRQEDAPLGVELR